MIHYERPVRFEEVDAAGIVFFARFFVWCHEAMENFFGGVPGGYVGLITQRRIGFPAVHLASDWKTPLRYGDVARITTSIDKVGTTSTTFRHVVTCASSAGGHVAPGTHVATITCVNVCSDLRGMTKIPLPADCLALLTQHLDAPAPGGPGTLDPP